ncbi:toll/interleukin-1 receptor domain-containing protein [Streptomyces sp. enrichment culture]|uniref:toll/interleukin-1 receptor domain-containing protein n=1 Tax=Streptomyces sp. enrichment culture TaxID=1795815 RepID=UPI003F55FBB4
MSRTDILVNYRTSDEPASARLIADGLAASFGKDRVFWDHESIGAGRQYPELLRTAARTCRVLVAVIGERWLEARDARGRLRLENPDDWTRREILEVLDRGAHVIPVLVAPRTSPLVRAELPDGLAELADLQFRQFNPRTRDQDIATLCRDLAELLPGAATDHGPAAPTAPAAPSAADTRNVVEDSGQGSITVQARDVSGSLGSFVSNPQGPVHTGSGAQHNTTHNNTTHHNTTHAGSHNVNFHGDRVNYVAGTNNGGMHQGGDTGNAGQAEGDGTR